MFPMGEDRNMIYNNDTSFGVMGSFESICNTGSWGLLNPSATVIGNLLFIDRVILSSNIPFVRVLAFLGAGSTKDQSIENVSTNKMTRCNIAAAATCDT